MKRVCTHILSSPLAKSQAGFTLLETVLYLALFALLMGSVVLAAYYVVQESTRVQAKVVVYQEANFVLRKIDWVLTGATAIADPLGGTTGSHLQLTKPAGTSELQLSSGKVQFRQDGGAYADLNNDFVTISGFTFQHVAANGGKPAAVVVTFTMMDNFGNSQSFSQTRNLRQ